MHQLSPGDSSRCSTEFQPPSRNDAPLRQPLRSTHAAAATHRLPITKRCLRQSASLLPSSAGPAKLGPSDEPHTSRRLHARVPVREAVPGLGTSPVCWAPVNAATAATAVRVVVTWCIGHLVEAVPPEGYGEQYKRWAIEQLPILPRALACRAQGGDRGAVQVVQQLVAKAGELVIATDADREGEMIAREIIELCGYRGPIRRLWLSALNDASIRKGAGRSNRPPNAAAVLLRARPIACRLADRDEPEPPVHAARAPGRLQRRAVGRGCDADAQAGGGP